jgi:hypothetical protein
VVADAALGRTARNVVHDAKAFEDANRAVVHARGDGDDERLLTLEQDVQHVLVDVADLGGAPELRARHLPGVFLEV